MNIIYTTMGSLFGVYYNSYKSLSEKKKLGNIGFYVCDKQYFENFSSTNSYNDISIMKEWELYDEAMKIECNISEIKKIENTYFNDESFWNCLYNDRRIFMGKYCKHTQDYTPRYTHQELLKIFQLFSKRIENFINEISPDVIVGFTPTTIGEYLFFKIAKQNKIKSLILRPTKIKNNLTFTDYFDETYPEIKKDYELFRDSSSTNGFNKDKAIKYVSDFNNKNGVDYEGLVVYNYEIKKILAYPFQAIRSIIHDISSILDKKDNHIQGLYFKKFLYDGPYRDIKSIYHSIIIKKRLKSLTEIKKESYVFFPLHSEPEIAITLFSRPHYNQIEVIRNIALQLPSDFKLLVKEHPRNIGRRSANYYRKILDIPNVDFAMPSLSTVVISKHTKMTIVLAGFVGFETLLNKKPVITLGSTSFNMLPKTMINNVSNIKYLYKEIHWSLSNFNYDESVIISFISSIIKNSIPIDLYTVLLKKKGRKGGNNFSEKIYSQNIERLTNFIISKIY